MGGRKARLLEIFGHWNDNVVDLIKATPEEDVLRRDIYDRWGRMTWGAGRGREVGRLERGSMGAVGAAWT